MKFEYILSIRERALQSRRFFDDPRILEELNRDLIAARQAVAEASGAPLVGVHSAVSEVLRQKQEQQASFVDPE